MHPREPLDAAGISKGASIHQSHISLRSASSVLSPFTRSGLFSVPPQTPARFCRNAHFEDSLSEDLEPSLFSFSFFSRLILFPNPPPLRKKRKGKTSVLNNVNAGTKARLKRFRGKRQNRVNARPQKRERRPKMKCGRKHAGRAQQIREGEPGANFSPATKKYWSANSAGRSWVRAERGARSLFGISSVFTYLCRDSRFFRSYLLSPVDSMRA